MIGRKINIEAFLALFILFSSCEKEEVNNIVKYDPNKHDFVGILLEHRDIDLPFISPVMRLYDSTFKHSMTLLGDITNEHSELIIGIIGTLTGTDSISVSSYQLLSRISYHDFLVREAGEYTANKYSCLTSIYRPETNVYCTKWDKSFGWVLGSKDYTPILKVRMTNTFSTDTIKPYYELWYNGVTGDFIKEIRFPDMDFCN